MTRHAEQTSSSTKRPKRLPPTSNTRAYTSLYTSLGGRRSSVVIEKTAAVELKEDSQPAARLATTDKGTFPVECKKTELSRRGEERAKTVSGRVVCCLSAWPPPQPAAKTRKR